jgi:hypothetical protein
MKPSSALPSGHETIKRTIFQAVKSSSALSLGMKPSSALSLGLKPSSALSSWAVKPSSGLSSGL